MALTEAVSISCSIAIKSEQHINGNQEFIGQRLAETELLSPRLGQYLNRLSDLLFVLSRRINRNAGQHEPVWRGPASNEGR